MSRVGRRLAGRHGGGLCHERGRRLRIRSLAFTTRCVASLPLVVPDCWNSRRKPAVLKLFSRQCCARTERCAYVKFRSSFVNAHAGNRKCHSTLPCDFSSAGSTRCSSISRHLGVKET